MIFPGGIALSVLTLVICAGMIVANKWIRKVTNCYFFWAAFGLFFFIWFLVFRFVPDWQRYATWHFTDPSSQSDSYVISKAFLLDVCPFASLALCVLLMADPSRKAARSFAPISLIGGLITVMSLGFDSVIQAEFTAQFIFIGTGLNKCYFIMHFFQVVFSVGVMLNTPRNGWKGTLLTFIIICCYYGYVGIIMAATGCRWNVSGLSINDWSATGEYHYVAEIFNIPPQVCQIIGIPFLMLVGCGIVAIKDYVFDRGWFRYGNAYSRTWYLWYDYNKFVKQRIL